MTGQYMPMKVREDANVNCRKRSLMHKRGYIGSFFIIIILQHMVNIIEIIVPSLQQQKLLKPSNLNGPLGPEDYMILFC